MGRNGKSRALICFVLCMIMALPVYFSSAVAVKAAEQQTIIIGTNAEYSPFEYLDDNGNITGFDYDLLEAIAKEENVKLVWKDMPFDSLMGSMEAGDVQVIAAGIGPTEDRKKALIFPMFITPVHSASSAARIIRSRILRRCPEKPLQFWRVHRVI